MPQEAKPRYLLTLIAMFFGGTRDQDHTYWDSNDLATGPLKLLLDETENSFWKEESYKFFDDTNISATQFLTTPISYFSENQIWVKNLFYDNKQYDLSLLLSYNESNELVLTVNSASESAREMDGITPALENATLRALF